MDIGYRKAGVGIQSAYTQTNTWALSQIGINGSKMIQAVAHLLLERKIPTFFQTPLLRGCTKRIFVQVRKQTQKIVILSRRA